MKKILKWINAVLFLAAFGISFVELARLAVVNASLIDLIKLGFGEAGGSAFAREMAEMIQEEIRPLSALAAALVVLMWLGVLLSVLLAKNKAYISSLCLALIQAAGVTGIYFAVDSKLEVFREGLSFFGMGSRVRMYSYTLGMWLAVYGLIVLFSAIGLALKEGQKETGQDPIMPEQFHTGRNPLENGRLGKKGGTEQEYLAEIRQIEREQGKARAVGRAGYGEQGGSGYPGGGPGRKIQAEPPAQKPQGEAAGQRPQQGAALGGQEPQQGQKQRQAAVGAEAVQGAVPGGKGGEPPVLQDGAGRKFTGAIAGLTGAYAAQAYALQEKEQVFFIQEAGAVGLAKEAGGPAPASVYYIGEYQEYCLEVLAAKSVFLKSGQPLGKGRAYYLPRGTEIYLFSRENQFRLA